MKYCPICYKEYNEKIRKCDCGYIDEKENLEDDDYKIYKFAKSIFLNKQTWHEADFECRYDEYLDNYLITDINEHNYSIAKVTPDFDKSVAIEGGIVALNKKVKSLIINPDIIPYDLLDESIVSSIFFGDRLKKIELDMLMMSGFLRFIEVDPKNECFCAVDHVLFNKDKTILYKFAPFKNQEEYFVPKEVKRIVKYAFWAINLKKVHVYKDVKIDKDAFYEDDKIEIIYEER